MEYDINKDYGVTEVLEKTIEVLGAPEEKRAKEVKSLVYALFIA